MPCATSVAAKDGVSAGYYRGETTLHEASEKRHHRFALRPDLLGIVTAGPTGWVALVTHPKEADSIAIHPAPPTLSGEAELRAEA